MNLVDYSNQNFFKSMSLKDTKKQGDSVRVSVKEHTLINVEGAAI